ncbi:Glycogen [starch] synthase isoform 2 [Hypsizygus marmoreus]|uniref:Glycogen [starch] synthase n=1 Tax=Hypsizygus marmoreus TaxID=39966 RepID=A0A369J6E2_HYPMA|nr:Glycogen [starch] synthase isoform 2 [Hypsizygus marmoreus]
MTRINHHAVPLSPQLIILKRMMFLVVLFQISLHRAAITPIPASLLSSEDLILLKRRIFALKCNSLPPITTHNVADDAADPINQIRRVKLFSVGSDRVKILFHPIFLDSSNSIFGSDFEEFVRGCHLGVFPSYYEPWGYTPAECTVMGIPAQPPTSPATGASCIERHVAALPVHRRLCRPAHHHTFSFYKKTQRQHINQHNRIKRLSPLLDWKNLVVEYSKATQLALRIEALPTRRVATSRQPPPHRTMFRPYPIPRRLHLRSPSLMIATRLPGVTVGYTSAPPK